MAIRISSKFVVFISVCSLLKTQVQSYHGNASILGAEKRKGPQDIRGQALGELGWKGKAELVASHKTPFQADEGTAHTYRVPVEWTSIPQVR